MPQDKGHDDTFPVVFIPPVQSVDNGQQREVSVGDPTMPIVQGTNNEQQGSVDITTRTISTIQPIDNANENAITSPIVFANTIQPTDNFPEDDITLPIVELKETNSPENEQDISINSPIIIVPPVQPIDNDKGIDINTPSVISEPIKPIDNDAKKHKVLPLSGKLITSEDPVTIGANFKTYKNLRPTATHPRAIGGMSKVNSANVMDATYLKTRSAYHLIKDQPAESHVLVQAYNAALTASQILDNATAIGTVGDFAATELWTDTGTVEYGKWSEATEGQVVYCNGTDTCIWGGNELRCPVFITSTATIPNTGDIANPKDFTSMINNTRQDVASVVALGGGVDSSTKLLIHANEADATAGTGIIDSSLTLKTITAVGNAQVDTDQAKFGTGSVKFDGTGDYLTLVDSADWYFAAAPFTIETWIKLSALNTYGICGQWDDANNYWYVGTGVSGYVKFVIKSGGAVKADYITQYAPLDGLWHHLAVVRNTTSVYIFVDGVSIPLTVNTAISTNEIPNLASTLYIGIMGAASAVEWPIYGWMDEFRISKGIARWTAGFTVPARAYSSSTSNWLIGSLRPLKGVKYYISSGNTTASVMTGKQWIGTTWETLALTDNTDTGASLAITGTVTFASTVTTARPRYISGYFLYWYQFSIDAGEATIYYVTLDAPFQRIVDIWDGVERNIGLCYLYKTSYADYTINAYTNFYDSADPSTYIELDGLTSSQYLLVGFLEQISAISILSVPDHTNAGSTADTTLTVYYWNGNDFASVGTISDGTKEGTVSLSKSGVISWNPPVAEVEFKKLISNGIPLYYYKLVWAQTLDADCQIYFISGIPAQNAIHNYRFSLYTHNRLLLCNDMNQKKNIALYSSADSSQVFNGVDSGEIEFGDETALTCGCSLFTQFGSNLYNLSLLYKDTEMWALTYTDNKWVRYKIADTIGCPAPLTLRTAVFQPNETIQNLNRYIAIWQAHNGIYITDGRAPILISKDIEDRFNRTSSTCINATYLRKSYGFIDELNQEYHWLYCNGTPGDATTPLNKEMVFSFKEWKWYEIDRTTNKYLQCGLSVHDTYGNALSYGTLDTGYMEALEWLNASAGTIKTFDGTDITCTIETGDLTMVEGEFFVETRVIGSMLVHLAKLTTTNNATLTHYVDTSTTAVSSIFDPTSANHRVSFPLKAELSTPAIFHSFKLVMITNDETIAFEPLALNMLYVDVRDHDYNRNW